LPLSAQEKVVIVPLFGDDAPTSKVVFITNGTFTGNLGGPEGADAKCQAEADNLPGSRVIGKKFKAWISGGLCTDFTSGCRIFIRSELPYRMLDGTLVAASFDALIRGQIRHNIDIKADSVGRARVSVWTGLEADGQESEATCGAWTMDGENGLLGASDAPINQESRIWTEDGADVCFFPSALYCFEQ